MIAPVQHYELAKQWHGFQVDSLGPFFIPLLFVGDASLLDLLGIAGYTFTDGNHERTFI